MNSYSVNIIKRTGFAACLFFCLSATAQELTFTAKQQRAYDLTFRLKTEQARTLISKHKTIDRYIESLAETIELLVTEREDLFSIYEDHFFERQEKQTNRSSAEDLFLQAEIHLHWAFVYLKFGHEFDAARSLREAYQISKRCREQYPHFEGILKTWGLLQIMVGSIPDKYNWILSLLGLEGSVEEGLKFLDQACHGRSPIVFEAKLLRALIDGFISQQPERALSKISILLNENPDHKLLLFLGSSLSIKSAVSAQAEKWLNQLSSNDSGLPLHYQYYLLGEVLLHKGAYQEAINSYTTFLKNYKGNNYIKDAHYKIGICNYLAGQRDKASAQLDVAKSAGIESTEADRFAARSLAEDELPNAALSKVRYFTDGGYYVKADSVIIQHSIDDFKTKHDRVEFLYRKARLAHKQNRTEQALSLYKQVISDAGDASWYFAPNACLQLGYIYLEKGNEERATIYFEKAISYRKHAYKNSIDSKARSALNQMKRK